MKRMVMGVLALVAALVGAAPGPGGAAPAAPALVSPQTDYRLENFSPTLSWKNPPGSLQYQLRVLPYANDGPGINLIRGLADSYTVVAPGVGGGNYVLLPDMSYTWQVRASDVAGSIGEDHASWSEWSETRSFRTPSPQSELLVLTAPLNGQRLRGQTATLQWTHPNPSIFYYEVQVSTDPQFRTGADAQAAVWWNLVHGGLAQPHNSWTTPQLEPEVAYYWRVRPRVQGDGTPTDWAGPWRFNMIAAAPCCQAFVSFDKPRPQPDETVTVLGRLTDWSGGPIAGASMRAVWRYDRGPTVLCEGSETDEDGRSRCSRRIERYSGDRIAVTVEFTYQSQTYTDTGYITPN
ncbi:MAG: hypothetical protein NTZ05_15000 [Chloroflexi bacterium]|nr:hypothetical protein [Chloroflexota bacterium]